MRGPFRRGWHRQLALELCRTEEGLQLIIVALRKRFRFVIMAARAADCLTQKNQRRRIGHVIQRVVTALDLICRIDHVRPEQVEASRDQCIWIVREQFVSGQLLPNKAVVRLVGVE